MDTTSCHIKSSHWPFVISCTRCSQTVHEAHLPNEWSYATKEKVSPLVLSHSRRQDTGCSQSLSGWFLSIAQLHSLSLLLIEGDVGACYGSYTGKAGPLSAGAAVYLLEQPCSREFWIQNFRTSRSTFDKWHVIGLPVAMLHRALGSQFPTDKSCEVAEKVFPMQLYEVYPLSLQILRSTTLHQREKLTCFCLFTIHNFHLRNFKVFITPAVKQRQNLFPEVSSNAQTQFSRPPDGDKISHQIPGTKSLSVDITTYGECFVLKTVVCRVPLHHQQSRLSCGQLFAH